MVQLPIALDHLGEDLEVVDVEARGEGVEKPGLLVEGVGEGVGRADRHDDVVAGLRVQRFLLAVVAVLVEADGSLGDEEGLVVHLVPVGDGPACAGRDDEFAAAEALEGVCAVFHDAEGHRPDLEDLAGLGGHEDDGLVGLGEGVLVDGDFVHAGRLADEGGKW